MNLSTFREFQTALKDYAVKKTGQNPHSSIFVFADKTPMLHTHQDNGTPHLYRALRDKKKIFLGGCAFTRVLVGALLVDRATPMSALSADNHDVCAAMIGAAAKSWLALPEGSPAGVVPCPINIEDGKAGLHTY